MGFGTSALTRRARAFVEDTRAGATAIAAAAATVMTVGGAALIVDHLWLVDQRDVLKTAADAASLAATQEMDRRLGADAGIGDDALKSALESVARRYVLANLAHLAPERFKRARKSLKVEVVPDRDRRTVSVKAKADLGGTLFARNLPLLGNYAGPGRTAVRAGVETESIPVEVVLAIDVSGSMRFNLAGGPGGASRMATVKDAATRLVDILGPNAHNRVAVGLAPWHVNVRLDPAAARRWARKRWAVYPAERTYPVPYACFTPGGSTCAVDPVVDVLPAAPARSAWAGCLDGHRLAGTRGRGPASLPAPTAAALFVSPATRNPFAQSYFPPANETAYLCRHRSQASGQQLFAGNCYSDSPEHWAQFHCESSEAALLPLSTEPAAIRGAIDALEPDGVDTYSALGVLWAQRMLEPSWRRVWGGAVHPADPENKDEGFQTMRKAIVLLTDGEDEYCGRNNPDCSGTPLAISRTRACALAKEKKTEIFVIAAMAPNRVSSALGDTLRACSSENDRDYPDGTRRPGATYAFLNNATPEALAAAFAEIAKQLRTLRKVS